MSTGLTLSIVIPVHNVSAHIETCLRSILSQYMGNLEVICVDDKSPDDSALIIENLREKDGRVTLIRLDANVGVSTARNIGIGKATGEYLLILDSDDFIEPGTLRKVVDHAERTQSDIVFYDAYKYFSDSIKERYRYIERNHTLKDMSGHAAWWYIFRRVLVSENPEVRFPANTHPHEDTTFSFMLFSVAQSHSYLPIPVVAYRQHKEMIMKQLSGAKKGQHLQSAANATKTIYKFYNSDKCDRQLRYGAYVSITNYLSKIAFWKLPIGLKILFIKRKVPGFIYQKKLTKSNKLLIKLCKIPIYNKRLTSTANQKHLI